MVHLVTGGSGYFGEILTQHLLKRGEAVRVFDRVSNPDRPAEIELIQGDIRDVSRVARAMQGVRVVHHNVAQVPLAKDKALFWAVNVDGTRNILEAALKAKVEKVVITSSSAVHGIPAENPVTELTPPAPREEYGRAKLAAEKLADVYRQRGLSVSVVRPRTVLGHGRLGIFSVLFEWVRSGRPVYLLGPGHNRYQFVHADDLAEVCVRAAYRPESDLYLAGTDRFGSMRELLSGLIQHAGSSSPLRSLPFQLTSQAMRLTSKLGLSPLGDYHSLMYGREMYFDIDPTRQKLGWEPSFSNAEMIADSYDWYLANREQLSHRVGASHHRSPVKLGVLKLLEKLP